MENNSEEKIEASDVNNKQGMEKESGENTIPENNESPNTFIKTDSKK